MDYLIFPVLLQTASLLPTQKKQKSQGQFTILTPLWRQEQIKRREKSSPRLFLLVLPCFAAIWCLLKLATAYLRGICAIVVTVKVFNIVNSHEVSVNTLSINSLSCQHCGLLCVCVTLIRLVLCFSFPFGGKKSEWIGFSFVTIICRKIKV